MLHNSLHIDKIAQLSFYGIGIAWQFYRGNGIAVLQRVATRITQISIALIERLCLEQQFGSDGKIDVWKNMIF